jgi:hypothetical protein
MARIMARKWTDDQVLAILRAATPAERYAIADGFGMPRGTADEFCGSSKRRALVLRDRYGIPRRKRWQSPITTSFADQRRLIEDALRRD